MSCFQKQSPVGGVKETRRVMVFQVRDTEKFHLFHINVTVTMLSRVRLFWDPMDCGPPGSSVHGILRARILEWVAMPSSRASSRHRDPTRASCFGRWALYHWATREALTVTMIYHQRRSFSVDNNGNTEATPNWSRPFPHPISAPHSGDLVNSRYSENACWEWTGEPVKHLYASFLSFLSTGPILQSLEPYPSRNRRAARRLPGLPLVSQAVVTLGKKINKLCSWFIFLLESNLFLFFFF